MKVFTCNDFQGHYPVGAAAVIVAGSKEEALVLLQAELSKLGLYPGKPFARKNKHLTVEHLVEVSLAVASVDILVNGNY